MMATRAMITAARCAEYDYYQRRHALGDRFIPTPDAVIKAMVQAVLDQLDPPETPAPTAEPAPQKRSVIVAHPPRGAGGRASLGAAFHAIE